MRHKPSKILVTSATIEIGANFWQGWLGHKQKRPIKTKIIRVLVLLTFEECMDWSPTYDLLKFCTKMRIARSSLCLLNS
jgi:hypothetical protein